MTKSVAEILSVDNPVFSTFIFYTSILIIKMLLMGPFTAIQRIRKKVIGSNWTEKYLLVCGDTRCTHSQNFIGDNAAYSVESDFFLYLSFERIMYERSA